MSCVVADFETRSRCDLKKSSAWKYAAHPSTEVLCLALKVDDQPARIWIPDAWLERAPAARGLPLISRDEAVALLASCDEVSAWNAEFEHAVWTHVMHARHGWPRLPVDKLRCTASRAAMCSLPRSLGEACRVLRVPVQKDADGAKLMLKMCKPVKSRRKVGKEWVVAEHWHEDPADFVAVAKYCCVDVDAERAMSKALPHLPASELRLWQLDQRMNARGIMVDADGVRAFIRELSAEGERLSARWRELVGPHGPSSPKQVAATLDYFAIEFGADMPDLAKDSVSLALAELAKEEGEA